MGEDRLRPKPYSKTFEPKSRLGKSIKIGLPSLRTPYRSLRISFIKLFTITTIGIAIKAIGVGRRDIS
jgi:hypothetical protein